MSVVQKITLFVVVALSILFYPYCTYAFDDQSSYSSIQDIQELNAGEVLFSNLVFHDYSTTSTLAFGLTGNVVNHSDHSISYSSTVSYYDASYHLIAQSISYATATVGESSFHQMSNLSILDGHSVSEIAYYQLEVHTSDNLTSEITDPEDSISEEQLLHSHDYTLSKYDVNIIVNENNTFDITETITAHYNTPKHGIIRDIPLKNEIVRLDGTTSKNRAQVTNVRVNHEYTTQRTIGNYRIQIGSPDAFLTGEETYVIQYTYNIGKDPIKGYDELYFNIIGDKWDTVIQNITFSITMPKEFDVAKLGFSSGEKGSTANEKVEYTVKENVITGKYHSFLNSNEYKNLSETILKLDSELKQIDDKRINLTQKYGQDEEALKNKQATLEEKKQNQKVKHEIANLNEMFFKEEYNLHYIEKEPIENVKLAAKNILEKLSNRKNSDIDKVKYNYDDAYNNYRNELSDYHLTSNIIFDREIEPNDIIDNETLKDLHSKNKRVDLSAMYQGRVLNIYSLSKTIENAIEENNQIISEQDRHLFEEILLKSVGAKIRERIESSKNWVKEINQIMKQMQEGSSLSFGLEWKSKSAESMDEIETKELVRIFQIDPNMVTKSDSDKLINHFRSKLKRETEMNGESETYSSVIFDVLDYRNWFEFKMTYQRKGENKKELTNKVFSVFSGGEKAKTMYIPLFAAVYAKLMSAKKDAPRLIALDEAFAGVDDANIREMFGILSSLNLDYILTSQALWGDYDTISNLAIAELLRPNNAQAVCVKRYRWNGKVKEIVLKKELNDAVPLF